MLEQRIMEIVEAFGSATPGELCLELGLEQDDDVWRALGGLVRGGALVNDGSVYYAPDAPPDGRRPGARPPVAVRRGPRAEMDALAGRCNAHAGQLGYLPHELRFEARPDSGGARVVALGVLGVDLDAGEAADWGAA